MSDTYELSLYEQFVKKIEQGVYPNYHIRTIDNIKTPCSNPDGKPGNNLN